VRAQDEDGAAGSVGLGLELGSGLNAGKGKTLTGGVPLSATARERAREEKNQRRLLGRGRRCGGTGPAVAHAEGGEERARVVWARKKRRGSP
jgi:hypothetical protein